MPEKVVNVFRDNALKLYDFGFNVIPLTPGNKKPPLVLWRNKYQKQRPDRAKVSDWALKWPNANIAILTGNNIAVVDVDGPASVEHLEHYPLPSTLTATTQKGIHYYYKINKPTPCKIRFAPDIDLRGDGGYVVGPPSINKEGIVYSWVNSKFTINNLPLMPDWVYDFCNKDKQETTKHPAWFEEIIHGVEKGNRNGACAKLAGWYFRKDMRPEDVFMLLQSWNVHNLPPMEDKEVMTVVNSIHRKDGIKEATEAPSNPQYAICDLKHCKKVISKWLYFENDEVIDVVLAVTLSVVSKEDPVWLLLISAPSMGKTELLRPLKNHDLVYFISQITKNTFFSGLKGTKSILERIGEKKLCLVNKDFSSVLTMPGYDKTEVLGQLREVYDGFAQKEFGGPKPLVTWQGKLNFLGGVTPDIENHFAVIRALGERFMYYKIPDATQETRHKMLDKSVIMERFGEEAREEIKEAMQGVLEKYRNEDISNVTIDNELDVWLRELANVSTILRTHIPRDAYTREIVYRPSPEGPSRVYKAIKILMKTLAIIRGRKNIEPEDYDIAVKICMDSIPSLRRETLRALISHTGFMGIRAKDIAELTNYQTTAMAKQNLDDLAAVGVADRALPKNLDGEIAQNASYLYKMNEDIKQKMTDCGIIDVV